MSIKPLYLVMAVAAAVVLAPQLVSRTYAGDLNKEIPAAVSDPANTGLTEVAVLAGGCFWGQFRYDSAGVSTLQGGDRGHHRLGLGHRRGCMQWHRCGQAGCQIRC